MAFYAWQTQHWLLCWFIGVVTELHLVNLPSEINHLVRIGPLFLLYSRSCFVTLIIHYFSQLSSCSFTEMSFFLRWYVLFPRHHGQPPWHLQSLSKFRLPLYGCLILLLPFGLRFIMSWLYTIYRNCQLFSWENRGNFSRKEKCRDTCRNHVAIDLCLKACCEAYAVNRVSIVIYWLYNEPRNLIV